MVSGVESLREYLAASGVKNELLEPGAEMPTVPLAAAALGVSPNQIVKSVALQGKREPDVVVLAVVPGDRRIAPPKVAAALELSALKLAAPEVVLRMTGFAVGGVPPVGHRPKVPVVVDASLLAQGDVFGGGGDEHHMLRIAVEDIIRLTGAKVADIVVEAS
jgi:Cys-tRNA(Pro) deacylase